MARYRVSRTKAREFAAKMSEIENFCTEHGIQQSRTSDSYYFRINGRPYRVSNHTIAASNAHAYNDFGEQIRDKYHGDGEDPNTTYITAGKTRIMEIYNDMAAGFVGVPTMEILGKYMPIIKEANDTLGMMAI